MIEVHLILQVLISPSCSSAWSASVSYTPRDLCSMPTTGNRDHLSAYMIFFMQVDVAMAVAAFSGFVC